MGKEICPKMITDLPEINVPFIITSQQGHSIQQHLKLGSKPLIFSLK
jgi:hypothetical protein